MATSVIPAKAGIQKKQRLWPKDWNSAFAEMTDAISKGCRVNSHHKCNDFLDAYVRRQERRME